MYGNGRSVTLGLRSGFTSVQQYCCTLLADVLEQSHGSLLVVVSPTVAVD